MKKLSTVVTLTIVVVGAHLVLAQTIAPVGGRGGEKQKLGPVLSNRPPVPVRPLTPEANDAPTYADAGRRLQVVIDPKHGSLKSLRFPALFADAAASSIDRYITLDGLNSSELEDEVVGFQSRVDDDPPHVIVDCINRASGLAVRKIYQFDPLHDEVVKTVEIDAPSEKLMTIESVTALSEATRQDGYYYQYLTHTASRLVSYPTARIGDAYFINRRNYQSGVMTVTRPDIDFTYGEVQLFTNGVPEYMGVQSDGYLPIAAGIETLLLKDGWQLPRGSFVKVGPGRGPQRVSWLYSATKGTHLMWHSNYHKRYFFPAFAPERRIDKAIDLAFDISFLWPHAVAKYKDGRLIFRKGDPEIWHAFLEKKWEKEVVPIVDEDGEQLWRQNVATFDSQYEMFESLDLDSRSWATLGLAETMYTMGDFFGDHMWYAPFVPRTNEDVFKTKKVSMKEYFRFVRALQKRWPRFKLFNYERGGYYPRGDTIFDNPHFAFYPIPDGDRTRAVTYAPRWNHYYRQMTDKYRTLQREGVSLYVDWAVAGADAHRNDDGQLYYQGYEVCQNAVRKMARELRDAGGFFFANQPSSPWADLGYIEGGSWDTDTQVNWRYWAERLNLYKLHEFRPNTIVALDMMCDEFIHQCLLYNFVPNTMNRVGVPTKQSWAPRELIRLRWYLREASMAPVPLRPVAWETPGSPLETSVMTLPGTVYLGAYNHIVEDHTADLSVDLTPVIGRRPYAVWRADVTQGPWAGLVSPEGVEPHKQDGPNRYYVGYKFEVADVTFQPYEGVEWNGLQLLLPKVTIPKRQSTYFFLSTVPALVRYVEGKDILWPVSSQPHIHIKHHSDGTLLVTSDYTEVVLAMDPTWLAKDAVVGRVDAKTGWPTITVRPGTWRLRTDGRLLYESLREESVTFAEETAAAAPRPLTTSGPVGVQELAVDNVVVLQNGRDGYSNQTGEQLTSGQWGPEGHNIHGGANGPDTIFLYANRETSRHARSLLRFELGERIPQSAQVERATLVIHCYSGVNGNSVLAAYPVLKPWTDGKTFWKNWGQGGSAPGYVAEQIAASGAISAASTYHFSVAPSVVQAWLDRPAENYGLLLKSIRDSDGFHWTADGDIGKKPPQLIVEYILK